MNLVYWIFCQISWYKVPFEINLIVHRFDPCHFLKYSAWTNMEMIRLKMWNWHANTSKQTAVFDLLFTNKNIILRKFELSHSRASQSSGSPHTAQHLAAVEMCRTIGEWILEVTRCVRVVVAGNAARDEGALDVLIGGYVAQYQVVVQSGQTKHRPDGQQHDEK